MLMICSTSMFAQLTNYSDDSSTIDNDTLMGDTQSLRDITWDSDLAFPNNVQIYPGSGNDTVPPFDFRAKLKCSVKNTFNKLFYYTEGTTVPITISSTVPFNLYFFNVADPSLDSKSLNISTNLMGKYNGSSNWTARQTSVYMVLIMPANNYSSGSCNVTIGTQTFNNVLISNNYLAYAMDNNHEYNIFTNRSSHDFKLCVFEGSNPGKVVAYNDNYTGTGDFDWGTNARIKQQFANPVSGVAVFTNYNPSDIYNSVYRYTDLYMGCETDTSYCFRFPNLKKDDVIRSAPESNVYDGFSWAVGNWLSYELPSSVYSQYYDPNPLTAFDNYFNAHGFTRTGATEANAAIDLWQKGDYYSHASVKNKAHQFATGYAWESKLGLGMRAMHPRYALISYGLYGYGNVAEHYTPVDWPYLASDEIGENTSFSAAEVSMINTMKNNLPNSVVNSFNQNYSLLVNDSSLMAQNNLETYCSSPYYTQILQICYSNDNAIALVFDKLNEGDIVASVILQGLTLTQNMDVIQNVWHYNDSLLTNTMIRRTNLSNATMYSKGIMAKMRGASMSTMFEDTSYSTDEHVFSIRAQYGQIEITLPLETPCNTSIFLARSDGQHMRTILKKRLDAGEHHIGTPAPAKGIYTVHVVINGRIYSKKVVVN